MAFDILIFLIVLAALIIGSYTDFRKREVPDWLNYSIIFTGLVVRVIFSIGTRDWIYILEGLMGLGAFFVLALVLFYAGQWGGGDSKMLMGLGALIGLQLSFDTFLLSFIINTVLAGAVFGILFSVYLVVKNRSLFFKEFVIIYGSTRKVKYVVWSAGIILILLSLFIHSYVRYSILIIGFMVFISYYLYIYLKAVEKACMLVWMLPENITEGDWIAKDVVVKGKKICGPKDLGIEKEQIALLVKLHKQKKVDKVLVKNGFPFVPSFLIAFILTHFFGNVLIHIITKIY